MRHPSLRNILIIALIVLGAGAFLVSRLRAAHHGLGSVLQEENDGDEEGTPLPVVASPEETAATPNNAAALGGLNVLIADRGNNRLIEVTPEKRIVWEHHFNVPRPGLGADDAFFIRHGAAVIVNLEMFHLIEKIDYATKQVVWRYGTAGVLGDAPGFLNRPDDAYELPNGDVMVADIRNCRVIEIAPDNHLVRQYGVTKVCRTGDGYLNVPNGDTPLPNGHVLISTIHDHRVIELDEAWRPVVSLEVPLTYPSDPQPLRDGNILIADYTNPGKIIEMTRDGALQWQYFFADGAHRLNRPSLAIELANGNILANDDFNHRVVVIDKATQRIVWQYGVTGKPGDAPGQLNIPDGVDVIDHSATSAVVPTGPYTVGFVSRHAASLAGMPIEVRGAVLAPGDGYTIISDEETGRVNIHDLPVVGDDRAGLVSGKRYRFIGVVERSRQTANHNPYSLRLAQPPEPLP